MYHQMQKLGLSPVDTRTARSVTLGSNIACQAPARRIGRMVLDRQTCDWVIDEKTDSAVCRKHGEIADGMDSKHFPGAWIKPDPLSQLQHRILKLRKTKTLREIGEVFLFSASYIWRLEQDALRKLSAQAAE